MSTMRERWIAHVERFREYAHSAFGVRRFTLYVRRRTPADGRGGAGAEWHTSDSLFDHRFRVRVANARDIATMAGRVQLGDFIVDRITPRNDADTAGVWLEELDPKPDSPGEQVFFVLVGPGFAPYVDAEPPSGGRMFTRVHLDVTGSFQWLLVLRPVSGA